MDALGGLGARDLVLRLLLEILELNDAFFDLGLAEDHRDAGVDLVCPTELAFERAATKVALYAKPGVSQLPAEHSGLGTDAGLRRDEDGS